MPGPNDKSKKLSERMGNSFDKEKQLKAQQSGMRRASAISVAATINHGLGDAEKLVKDCEIILHYIEHGLQAEDK